MPKRKTTMPLKGVPLKGVIDIHFHGAYGVDILHAPRTQLSLLQKKLFRAGINGFYPTTLSASSATLKEALPRLGSWIHEELLHFANAPSKNTPTSYNKAIPLGIHLEGPFLSPQAAGAHPPEVLQKPSLEVFIRLQKLAHGQIRIITLAPEETTEKELKKIIQWAEKSKVYLSLGHSNCNYQKALGYFKQGLNGVTHAFNAMTFHHRDPGILGACSHLLASTQSIRAKGRRLKVKKFNPAVEAIVDQIHLHPETIEFLRKIFPENLCYVSDNAPAAGLKTGRKCHFGDMEIEVKEGACRIVKTGALAGSSVLLPEAILKLTQHTLRHAQNSLHRETSSTPTPNVLQALLKKHFKHATEIPLRCVVKPFPSPSIQSKAHWEGILQHLQQKHTL